MYAKILLMTAVLLSGQLFAQDSAATAPIAKAKVKAKKKLKKISTVTTPAPEIAPVVASAEVKKEEVKKEIPATVSNLNTSTNYIKDHFAASYHGEFYALRRDGDSNLASERKIQDFKIMHNPTLIYNPTKEWKALVTAEFKYSDIDNEATYPNSFYRALLTLTRKNILTEKDNGIQLDAGVGRRQFNSGIQALPSYGNNRIFSTLTKNYGKNSASLFLQYLNNHFKKSSATTWKNSLELIPTVNLQLTDRLSYLWNDDIIINTAQSQGNARDASVTHEMNAAYLTYQWTDKLNTYYQLKYYHSENFTNASNSKDDYFEHYVGVGYSFTPKATVTFEVGSEIFHARDGRDFFAKKSQYPEFALYLDFAI